ncbi:MAG: hypothetical protein ACYC6C_05845, partial [Coriobacteriia bacterium]
MADRRTMPRRRRSVERVFGILIALILIVIVLALGAGWAYLLRPDHDIAPGRAVQIEITPGMST